MDQQADDNCYANEVTHFNDTTHNNFQKLYELNLSLLRMVLGFKNFPDISFFNYPQIRTKN